MTAPTNLFAVSPGSKTPGFQKELNKSLPQSCKNAGGRFVLAFGKHGNQREET